MDHNQNTIATINHQRAIRIKLYHHSWLFHRLLKNTGRCREEIETLRNYNGDGKRERLKQNSFYEQNNNSARASRFLYISLPSLPNYDVKWPNFELTWERERQGDKFCFLSLNSDVVPSLQF